MTFQEKKEIYKKIIVSLDYCVDDYLYILDVEKMNILFRHMQLQDLKWKIIILKIH